MSSDEPASGMEPDLTPWANLGLDQPDEEIIRIHQLEQQARPLPPVAIAIRELITRLEICHFKVERHVQRILEAIGRLSLDFEPASIGSAHPKSGESAWLKDKTGRSRQGQEFIWVLQMWLADAPYSMSDNRPVPPRLFEEVTRALGARDTRKTQLVSALLNRLLLKTDRAPLPTDLAGFWVPIERMDICHYAFPLNLERMIEAIGRLEPPADVEGCGSCGESQRQMAEAHVRALYAWLRGEPGGLAAQLGERSPVRKWLVACLAKTLRGLAGIGEAMPGDCL